jgi:hypothetical protein
MTTPTASRQAAAAKLDELIAALRAHPGDTRTLIEESDALARAIAAFHMEGIRFRIFNVDRLMSRAGASVPPGAPALLEEVRHHLEAAGFHTRSHQAPG